MSGPTTHALEAGTIPLGQAAALLMLSEKRLRQLADAGYLPIPIRGRVPMVPAIQGFLRYMKDDQRRAAQSAAASRVLDARAQEIEQRNERRAQKLIDEAIEEALAMFDEAAGGLKAGLLAVPARVTNDLTLRRRLEAEISEALRAAADRSRVAAAEARAAGAA